MPRATTLFVGLLLTGITLPLAAQSPERFTLTGDRIAVYNLAGTMTVEPGTGSDVTVEVTRLGTDGRQLRIETGPISGSEALRVIFPGDQIIYRQNDWDGRTEMNVREDGTFGGGWDDRGRGRGHRVQIRSRGEGLEAHAQVRVLVPAGKEVGVFLGLGSINASNVNGTIRLDAAAGDITADRVRGRVTLDTGSGDVEVTSTEGPALSIDTGSGNVRVTGAGSAEVTIDTGSGDVSGSDITTTDLSVDTGSGNISLQGVKASSVNMDTGSGDVEVALLTDTDDIMVDTGSGNVTLTVPSGFGSAVDLSTSSGEVDTEIEIQVTRRGRQHLVGRIGDGEGRMTIETGSGDVTIRGSR